MKTKLSKIILIMIIALGLGTIISNAAISGNAQTINSGENVTITINSSEKLGSYKVSLTSDGGLTYVSCTDANGGQNGNKTIAGSPASGATKLGSFTFKAPTVTTDTKYTVKFSATAMETPDLDPVADSSTSVVITVNAPEPPKQEENTNQGGTTTTPPANDNNNNTSNGSGTSDNNTSTGNGTSNNTGSSGSGSGTTTEQPEQKPVEKPVEKSSNNKLKNLGIRPNDFSGFKANTTKYDVSVPNDVSEVEVYAEAQDSKATISGTGKMQLRVGSNQAKVVCTAEDGTTKTYIINITRKEVEKPVEEKPVEEEPEVVEEPEEIEPEEEELPQVIMGLSKLEAIGKNVEGKGVDVELSPAFDENTQEYVLIVPLSVVDVEINAVAVDGDAKVEVMGNKNLVEGENIITVIVKIGENTKVYEIKVNKVAVEESFLSQELIMQLAVIAAIITLVIVAIAAIIIMIAKNSKNEKESPRRAMSSEEIINGILEREAQQEKGNNKTE